VGRVFGIAILLAVAAAIWGLLSASRGVLAWCLVAGYVAWPAVWALLKPIVTTPGDLLLFPTAPLGRVFPNPELLGVRMTGGRLQKLRTRATRSLASFVEIGLWPAAGLAGRTLHTVGTGSARVLRPHLGIYAAVSALFAVMLVGIRAWSGPSSAVTVATAALLMTLTARHLLWILSGEDFRRLLKRSSPNPYVTLVTLAVFDYIALVAITIVLRWRAGDGVDTHRAVAEARDLLALRHLTQLPKRADLSPLVVVLAVAVAAYWASLASQVLRFPAFRRDYDDRAWLNASWEWLRGLDDGVHGQVS